jgi:predicted ATPase
LAARFGDTLADVDPFIRGVVLIRDRIDQPSAYPFSLPAVRALDGLSLSAVTYFVGENGSGKSTLLEAIAVAAGFNPEGGTQNFSFSTRRSESPLDRCIRLTRGVRRPRTGFFLRAESFFNVATEIERLDSIPANAPPIIDSYGGRSLHEQSHGESFLALVKHRFGNEGLYVLDEPEAALSPTRQLALLRRIHELVSNGSQFIIATHAPIVLAYPTATIYRLDETGISQIKYEDAEQVSLTRDFLNNRERYLHALLSPADDDDDSGRTR